MHKRLSMQATFLQNHFLSISVVISNKQTIFWLNLSSTLIHFLKLFLLQVFFPKTFPFSEWESSAHREGSHGKIRNASRIILTCKCRREIVWLWIAKFHIFICPPTVSSLQQWYLNNRWIKIVKKINSICREYQRQCIWVEVILMSNMTSKTNMHLSSE